MSNRSGWAVYKRAKKRPSLVQTMTTRYRVECSVPAFLLRCKTDESRCAQNSSKRSIHRYYTLIFLIETSIGHFRHGLGPDHKRGQHRRFTADAAQNGSKACWQCLLCCIRNRLESLRRGAVVWPRWLQRLIGDMLRSCWTLSI